MALMVTVPESWSQTPGRTSLLPRAPWELSEGDSGASGENRTLVLKSEPGEGRSAASLNRDPGPRRLRASVSPYGQGATHVMESPPDPVTPG